MPRLQARSVESAAEVRKFPNGHASVLRLDETVVGYAVYEPGWRWSEHIKPIAGTESCQVTHTGYMISGRIGIRLDDGTEAEYGPGDAYFIPPGHDGWVIGDEPAVGIEITGAATFAKPA